MELRQLIRESIQEYIREIDEAGEKAAMEAKITKIGEAIALREKKCNMEGLDEAMKDMIDPAKVKNLKSEIKVLEKSLSKYKKQLEKIASKFKDSSETETEDKEIVDEVSLSENEGEDYNSMDDQELIQYAEQEGMEEMIVLDGEGGLANRDEVIEYLSADYLEDSNEVENMEETRLDESMLHMQKLAGIITEGQYKKKVQKIK